MKPLNQLDPRWQSIRLGSCSDATIGSDGCLITCFSMLCGILPDQTNALMKENAGYYEGCLAATFALNRIGLPSAPELKYVSKPHQKTAFPPSEVMRVFEWTGAGNPAMVCIDRTPATAKFDQHWILLLGSYGTPGDEDFIINDPYKGVQCSFSSRYGRDFGRAFVRSVLYTYNDTSEIASVVKGAQMHRARLLEEDVRG